MTQSNGTPYVEVQLDLEHLKMLKSSLEAYIAQVISFDGLNIPAMMERVIKAWMIHQVLDTAQKTLIAQAPDQVIG